MAGLDGCCKHTPHKSGLKRDKPTAQNAGSLTEQNGSAFGIEYFASELLVRIPGYGCSQKMTVDEIDWLKLALIFAVTYFTGRWSVVTRKKGARR